MSSIIFRFFSGGIEKGEKERKVFSRERVNCLLVVIYCGIILFKLLQSGSRRFISMSIRAFLAICLCKLLRLISRLLHRGGTAMPGQWALKVCPDLLSILARDVKSVAITGTNGKTTTARMIEQGFADAGLNYMANRSGANLISGITTEFVMNSTL